MKMRTLPLLAALLAPLTVLAAPNRGTATWSPPSRVISARQGVVTPPPCEAMDPPPTEEETEARFDAFAEAFVVKKNLTEAFEYISSTYINHNPMAENGPGPALDALGPIWPTVEITPIRRTFDSPMGWVNYEVSGMGEVVDRFRWEAGCIVEHWDQGEVYPES